MGNRQLSEINWSEYTPEDIKKGSLTFDGVSIMTLFARDYQLYTGKSFYNQCTNCNKVNRAFTEILRIQNTKHYIAMYNYILKPSYEGIRVRDKSGKLVITTSKDFESIEDVASFLSRVRPGHTSWNTREKVVGLANSFFTKISPADMDVLIELLTGNKGLEKLIDGKTSKGEKPKSKKPKSKKPEKQETPADETPADETPADETPADERVDHVTYTGA